MISTVAASRPSVAPEMGGDLVWLDSIRVVRSKSTHEKRLVFKFDKLAVAEGDRLGVIGETGSGKTTLLETIGLLTWPELEPASRFEFTDRDGVRRDLTEWLALRDVDELTRLRARSLGFIPQNGGLLPYLTVRENAVLAVRLAEAFNPDPTARIERVAEGIGMGDLLDRLPETLSGGQRQRAAVLRALAPSPRLLLGDEPTAALDRTTARLVMQHLVASAGEQGAAVIVASHDVELLREFGFRLVEVVTHETGDVRIAHLHGIDL